MANNVKIGKVRFSYLHVFEPDSVGSNGDAKYSVSLIIPKSNTELVGAVKAAIAKAYDEGVASKFGGKAPVKGTWKNPLRDGDLERPDDEAYADSYFISASCRKKPGLVKWGPEGKLVDITDENDLFSGCYGYVSCAFYAFSNNGNKGVACGLNNLLLTDKGEYLGGRSSAQSDFGDMAPQPANDDSDIF